MTDKQQEVRNFLEKAVKDKGFSLNSLSLQLGKNSTYLFHFIKRHSPRRLDEPTRRKLAQILDIPEQRLCDYPVMGGLIQDKLNTISGLLGIGKGKNMYPIEIIDMSGEKQGNFDEMKNNVLGYEYLSPDMLKYYGFTNIENIKIFKNSGDAMAPTINSGDMIWVDTSVKQPSSDGIYLINTDKIVLLRRIQINPFNESLELSADNSAYKTFNIKANEDLDICGKVILLTRKL